MKTQFCLFCFHLFLLLKRSIIITSMVLFLSWISTLGWSYLSLVACPQPNHFKIIRPMHGNDHSAQCNHLLYSAWSSTTSALVDPKRMFCPHSQGCQNLCPLGKELLPLSQEERVIPETWPEGRAWLWQRPTPPGVILKPLKSNSHQALYGHHTLELCQQYLY